MESRDRPRVGFWWGGKKSRELSTEDFKEACASHGLELVKLDLTRSLEEQGPLAAIVHKFCDILVRADHGDAECQHITAEFERFCRAHPSVVVVDPLENVRKVLNRFHQYRLVEQSPLASTEWIFVPPFVELSGANVEADRAVLRERGVQFPIVCKPLVSHGMKKAHQMCLVFGEHGLADLQGPCVAQQFVPHEGRLLKVMFPSPTPALHSMPKLLWMGCPCHAHENFGSWWTRCGSSLASDFGIDIIAEKDTGRLCIIDVNNFPGYDGVSNFLDQLSGMLAELVGSELPDSGIDTSDSSDETPRRLHH
ncbi:hypothetical protein MRX96_033715 [Rhipicephalus microplus]